MTRLFSGSQASLLSEDESLSSEVAARLVRHTLLSTEALEGGLCPRHVFPYYLGRVPRYQAVGLMKDGRNH